jgi:hypothetical protein
MSKAGKTAATDAAAKRELWLKQTLLWQQNPTEWQDFLKQHGGQRVHQQGNYIKFCCPYHADSNPSAVINLTGGFFKCYSGSCGKWVRDPIQLMQRVMSVSYTEAFEAFRKHFQLTHKIRKDTIQVLDDAELLRKRAALAADAFHEYLCNCWVAPVVPESAKRTRDWLKQARKINDVSSITSLGMLPREDDLKNLVTQKGGDQEDWKWVRKTFGDYMQTTYTDAVVYMYGLGPEIVSAFKIRKPEADKESVRIVLIEENGQLGYFGVLNSAYMPIIANDRMDSAIVVEGEHDQLALFQGQLEKGIFDDIIVAAGGSGHDGLDGLADLGIKKVSVVGDDDRAGLDFPVGLLKKSRKISYRVFRWPDAIRAPVGKTDPDDAVKLYGFDAVYDKIKEHRLYTSAHRWCYERACERLTGVSEDNVVEQEATALEFGGLLKLEPELRAFADLFAKDYPLVPAVGLVKSILSADDSALGFIHSIVKWIKEEFHVVSVDNRENLLKLWHRARRSHVYIATSRKDGIITFKAYTPTGVLYEWARDCIGLPSYFPTVEADDASQQALSKATYLIEEALQNAFSVLAREAIDDPAQIRSQGIHLYDVAQSLRGYILNGNNLYKITWHEDGTQIKDVKLLDGPSDEGHVFDFENRDVIFSDANVGWLPWVKKPKDILARPDMDLRACYEQLRKIFLDSHGFKYQEVDATFCALYVIYTSVHDAMQKKSNIHVFGEFESGKSSLLALLCNHPQMPELSLVHHAASLDSYTPASLFQHFSGTRTVIGLDEANDPGDGSEQSNRMTKILMQTRGLATKGIADYNIGTQDRKGYQYTLHAPIVMASGTPIRDVMDQSRFNIITLRKNSGRANLRMMLRQKYGTAMFEALRRNTLLGALNLAPAFAAKYQEYYASSKEEHVKKINRFFENLIPLAAIADIIGIDGMKFMEDFRVSREGELQERAENTPGNSFFDALLNSPNIEIEVDDKPHKKTARFILQRADWRERINKSDTGLYFDEKTGFLFIAWAQVRQTLLIGSLHSYGRMAVPQLKAMISQSAFCMDNIVKDAHPAVVRMKAEGLAGAQHNWSVVDVNFIIQEAEQAHRDLAALMAAEAASAAPKSDDAGNKGNDGMNL